MSALLVPLAVLGLAALALVLVVKRLLFVASPSQLLVLSGTRRRVGGASVGYRTIRGGRAIQVPMLERLDVLELTSIAIHLESVEVICRGDLPLRLTVHAMVRPAAEEPRLQRALECFLGRGREAIAAITKQAMTGVLLAVARELAAKQIMLDSTRFTEQVLEEQEHALAKLGLGLDSLRITVVPDFYGYEKSLRR